MKKLRIGVPTGTEEKLNVIPEGGFIAPLPEEAREGACVLNSDGECIPLIGFRIKDDDGDSGGGGVSGDEESSSQKPQHRPVNELRLVRPNDGGHGSLLDEEDEEDEEEEDEEDSRLLMGRNINENLLSPIDLYVAIRMGLGRTRRGTARIGKKSGGNYGFSAGPGGGGGAQGI